jgi:hypothetical protein
LRDRRVFKCTLPCPENVFFFWVSMLRCRLCRCLGWLLCGFVLRRRSIW